MDRNKAGMKKLKKHHLLRIDSGILSGLQPGMRKCKKTTLHLLPIFADVGQSYCVLSSLVRGQRGGRYQSVVGGVFEFSHPCLVSVLF